MPPKEWLTGLHEAREREAGVPVEPSRKAYAFGLYMDALKEFEDEAARRPAGKKPYQQRWTRYDLERKLEVARDRQQVLETELADARRQQVELDTTVAGLHRQLETAREAGTQDLRRRNEWQQRQLEAASAFVRDLEHRLRGSEQQREEMARTTGHLEAEIRVLQGQVARLIEEAEPARHEREPALTAVMAGRAEGNGDRGAGAGQRDGRGSGGRTYSPSTGTTGTLYRKPPYFTVWRLIGFLLAATALVAGLYLSLAPYQDLRAYQRAQPCVTTVEDATTADCISQETGRVAQKDAYEEGSKDQKKTVYKLVVERASGSFEAFEVDGEVYSAAQEGSAAALKTWHGRVIEIAVGEEVFELAPMGVDFAWRIGLAWAGLGLLLWSLLGDRRFGRFYGLSVFRVAGWGWIGYSFWLFAEEGMGRGSVDLVAVASAACFFLLGAWFLFLFSWSTRGPRSPLWRREGRIALRRRRRTPLGGIRRL
ncbi:hypothetical protein F9278_25560 [Streptomyces phaeolivaceus]|uniref:Uncharacterized protein n=1 Tax=Streptomyces phaeolivaceus TaxID=2653200 RepID=A0A5P8K6K8_9ACTN|nr:hypothetical protein [Streptomyces phaeolivaceus]QFQ98963.1 hypothetical protein F9278_25560 [Streptomyces phaeolivaceus]